MSFAPASPYRILVFELALRIWFMDAQRLHHLPALMALSGACFSIHRDDGWRHAPARTETGSRAAHQAIRGPDTSTAQRWPTHGPPASAAHGGRHSYWAWCSCQTEQEAPARHLSVNTTGSMCQLNTSGTRTQCAPSKHRSKASASASDSIHARSRT